MTTILKAKNGPHVQYKNHSNIISQIETCSFDNLPEEIAFTLLPIAVCHGMGW